MSKQFAFPLSDNGAAKFDNESGEIRIPMRYRTKAQAQAIKHALASGDLEQLLRYMNSFSGKRQHVSTYKSKAQGTDHMAFKVKESVLRKFRALMRYDVTHMPTLTFKTNSPYIGVEIECFIPVRNPLCDLSDASSSEQCGYCDGEGQVELTNDDGDGIEEFEQCNACAGHGRTNSDESVEGILSNLFREHMITRASIKDDGSIDAEDGCEPVEITVLTRLDDPSNLRRVCDLLTQMGARVNKSCGLHVHLDMRHVSSGGAASVANRLFCALPVLAQCVPETRRNNSYCELRISASSSDRYCAINLAAFKKYRTVEVRLHSATTNFYKIFAWAKLIKRISETQALEQREQVDSFEGLERLGVCIPPELVAYFRERIRLFSGLRVNPSVADADNSDMRLTSTKLGVRIAAFASARRMRDLNIVTENSIDLAAGAAGAAMGA